MLNSAAAAERSTPRGPASPPPASEKTALAACKATPTAQADTNRNGYIAARQAKRASTSGKGDGGCALSVDRPNDEPKLRPAADLYRSSDRGWNVLDRLASPHKAPSQKCAVPALPNVQIRRVRPGVAGIVLDNLGMRGPPIRCGVVGYTVARPFAGIQAVSMA